ncbi:hypothetical protein V2W45_1233015, partial [Cenococcum geophilum]
ELFYCKRCQKQCLSLIFARAYLKNKHGIKIPLKTSKVDKAIKSTISALFNKQKEITANSVNKADFINALYYLIVRHNLSYIIIKWLEFRAFLYIYNYIVNNLLYRSANLVLLLISKTFVIYKDLVKKRLKKAILKVHFIINC